VVEINAIRISPIAITFFISFHSVALAFLVISQSHSHNFSHIAGNLHHTSTILDPRVLSCQQGLDGKYDGSNQAFLLLSLDGQPLIFGCRKNRLWCLLGLRACDLHWIEIIISFFFGRHAIPKIAST
jgi:hypothetical protein